MIEVCPICGEDFNIKPSRIKKCKVVCCSRECCNKSRSIRMLGENNHQFGLKGDKNASFKGLIINKRNNRQNDIWIYEPNHPFANSQGRVKFHRYIVEQNAIRFDIEVFVNIDGQFYLKQNYYDHHIDGNHDNNSVDNLQVVTKAEHRRLHNLMHPQKRDDITGRFLKEN